MNSIAIYNTHPSVTNIIQDNDGNVFPRDTNGNLVTLDETLITAETTRLQAEYDNAQYARDRATAYPSLTDQADMQYWDSVNGTTTWADAITAVKEAHPKP